MPGRATRFISEIHKLDYQERFEKLNLPTLAYRLFCDSMIETYKILHNTYDANCTNSFFELKEANTYGHKFAVKTKLSRTSIRQNFFSLQIINLPENIVAAPTTDAFKNRFDRHCR